MTYQCDKCDFQTEHRPSFTRHLKGHATQPKKQLAKAKPKPKKTQPNTTLKNYLIHHIPLDESTTCPDEVHHLYHISDIHIFSQKRHLEYRGVFQRLYQQLQKEPKGLIVLTGDIVDEKIKLSNELVILLAEFLQQLAKIMPVLMIAGNHDTNLNCRDRVDTLLGVLFSANASPEQLNQSMKTHGYLRPEYCRLKDVYYLHDTGLYQVRNICFSVCSIFDYQIIPASQISFINSEAESPPTPIDYRIALAHLTMHRSRLASGRVLDNESFTVQSFRGYDYVLLGDIHLPQFMNQAGTIGYAGSLLQKDRGEPIQGHGYLKWDLKAKTAQLQQIFNQYSRATLRFDEKSPDPLESQFMINFNLLEEKPRILDIVIKHHAHTPPQVITNYLDKLKAHGHQIEKKLLISESAPTTNTVTTSEYHDLSQLQDQNHYLKAYLTEQKIQQEQLEQIMDLHQHYYQQFATAESAISSTSINHGNWNLLQLKFCNAFCYQGSNLIDFRELSGIVGILGTNCLGKSSLIDIILFVIFKRCSRINGSNLRDLITKGESSCWIELELEAQGEHLMVQYIAAITKSDTLETEHAIYRLGKTQSENSAPENPISSLAENPAQNLSQTPEPNDTTTPEDQAAKWVKIAGKAEMKEQIKQLFGTYKDFVTTHVKLQSGGLELSEDKNAGQQTTLMRLLKLDHFDQIGERVKQDVKDQEAQLAVIAKSIPSLKKTKDSKPKTKKTTKTKNKEQPETAEAEDPVDPLEKLQNEIEEYQEKVTTIQSEVGEQQSQLKANRQQLNQDYEQLSNLPSTSAQSDVSSTSSSIQQTLDKYQAELQELQPTIAKLDQPKLAKDQEQYSKLSVQIQELEVQVKVLTDEYTPPSTTPSPIELEEQEQDCRKQIEELSKDLAQESTLLAQSNKLDKQVQELQKQREPLLAQLPSSSHNVPINKAPFEAKISDLVSQIEKLQTEQTSSTDVSEKPKNPENPEKLQTQISQIQTQTQTITIKAEHLTQQSKKLNELTFNPVCDDCQKTQTIFKPELEQYQQQKGQYQEQLSQLGQQLEEQQLLLKTAEVHQELNQTLEKAEKHRQVQSQLDGLTSQQTQLQTERQELLQQLSQAQNKRSLLEKATKSLKQILTTQKYQGIQSQLDRRQSEQALIAPDLQEYQKYQQLQQQVHAAQIQLQRFQLKAKIESTKQHINTLEKQLQVSQPKLSKDQSQLQSLQTQYAQLKEKLQQYGQLQQQVTLLKRYQKAIGRTGVTRLVITQKLPVMTQIINDVMQSLMPSYQIDITYQNEQLNLSLIKNNDHSRSYQLSLLCGLERFIVNLSMKMALSNLSNLSKPNFICLDEGFGVLSEEYLQEMDKLLENLGYRYQLIFLITHVEQVKLLLSHHQLEIQRTPGTNYSYINNTQTPKSKIKLTQTSEHQLQQRILRRARKPDPLAENSISNNITKTSTKKPKPVISRRREQPVQITLKKKTI